MNSWNWPKKEKGTSLPDEEQPIQLDVVLELINKSKYQEALALCDSYTTASMPQMIKIMEIRAFLKSKLGEYEDSLLLLTEVAQKSHPNSWNWRLAQEPISRLKLGRKETAVFWNSCMGPFDFAFDRARKSIIDHNSECAFQQITFLQEQGLSYSTIDSLRTVFEVLSSNANKEVIGSSPNHQGEMPSLVFLAGTGRSGVSAVKDYLSEFPELTSISGERTFFGIGAASLFEISESLGDAELTRRKFIDFVFHYLIGLGGINIGGDMKILEQGRKMWASENQDKQENYFNQIAEIVDKSKVLWSKDNLKIKRKTIHHLSRTVLEELILNRKIMPSETIMMTAFSATNVKASTIFESSIVICCLRDPRSSYAALRSERKAFFGLDALSWARKQSDVLCKVRSQVDEVNESKGHNVAKVIHFEDFVLSDSYRQEVAQMLKLNHMSRRAYTKFMPWESAKNVVLHESHIASEDIAIIAKELPEYCKNLGTK